MAQYSKIPILLLFYLIGGIMLLIIIGCGTQRKQETQKNQDIEEINLNSMDKIDALAKEHFKNNYKIIPNKSNSAVLVYKSFKPRPNDVTSTIHFLIYHNMSETMIMKDAVTSAQKIRWISEEEIEINIMPGRVGNPKAIPKGYIYNIQTKKKKSIFLKQK